MARRIDIHAHIIPTALRDWIDSTGYASGAAPPPWSREAMVGTMDEEGVDFAVVSIPMPRPPVEHDDRELARKSARSMNETSAELVKDDPDRFAFLATVPLPDVEGALEEVAYAFDELGAKGVLLLANVKGRYLGDPEFDPLMAELNRRGAVAMVHPANLPGPPLPPEIPPPTIDYMLDTTRAAVNLVRSGVTTRCPDLKFVLAHSGAFVPYMSHRIAYMTPLADGVSGGVAPPAHLLSELQRFYFDTALSACPTVLSALLTFSDADHIVFGSDWTFAPNRCDRHFTAEIDSYPFEADQRLAINSGNATRLFRLEE